MDLSNVPEGVNVESKISGILQNADESRIATMVEFWYWAPDTGATTIVGYDIDLQRNGESVWTGSTLIQADAVHISRNFINFDAVPA